MFTGLLGLLTTIALFLGTHQLTRDGIQEGPDGFPPTGHTVQDQEPHPVERL